MRVLFVGSLDVTGPKYEHIVTNLNALVARLADGGACFVIRDASRDTAQRIPIDHVIHGALATYLNNHPRWKAECLKVYKEPGVTSGSVLTVPHVPHSASTTYRIDFYRELLGLTDLVIGVGGEFGLMRLSISAEWLQVPILVLPGSGGTADFLWSDFFRKSYQLRFLSAAERQRLKEMPYINEASPADYAEAMITTIRIFQEKVASRRQEDIISPDNITPRIALHAVSRFSIGLWALLLSLLISLVTATYSIGNHIGHERSINRPTPPAHTPARH